MVAVIQPQVLPWQDRFCEMLPHIRKYAWLAFAHLCHEAREEAVAEVIANALVAFVRLVERGKMALAFPTVLARYAVAQYGQGRRIGTPTNSRDVMSPAARTRHCPRLVSLNAGDHREKCWKSLIVEDRSSGPASIAAFRVDFAAWLQRLPPRKRRLATDLAAGESTQTAARKNNLSPSRISQLRHELADSWNEFHAGDLTRRTKSL